MSVIVTDKFDKTKQKKKFPPIFIIGTERSGTNLLRLILNCHPDITVPHPPHIMKFFFGLEPLYGNLNNDIHFRRLVYDVVRMVELHPYPWNIKIDKEKVFKEAIDRNLISIFFQVYDQYLSYTGKKTWACKSTFMIRHVALVRSYFPDAKFIFMVRDGRDVAVSAKNSIFNHYHIYYTAKLWRDEQRAGAYWLKKLKDHQICLLKYEDLIKSPDSEIRRICNFLDVLFFLEMLDYFKTDEAKKCASLSISWKNSDKPVLSENMNKFPRELSSDEIRLFEAIAGNELDFFGYPLTIPEEQSESLRVRGIKMKLMYLLQENFLKLRAQIIHFKKDKTNILRYKKYWYLKYLWFKRHLI